MTRYAVGEHVTIRYGLQQGLKAIILKSLPADGYKVKVEDGSVRYYSGKGLESKHEGLHEVAS